MFGWGTPRCPISDESRAWVEKRMVWVVETFGARLMRDCEVILPTEKYFPDPYDGSEEAAAVLFDRVCGYLDIARARIELRFMTAGQPPRTFGSDKHETAAGTYERGYGDRDVITIDTMNLVEPMKLVAVSAHELCHVHLLGDDRVNDDEPDHEPLTDLLTVCMGMGIFGANSAFSDSAWSDATHSGWSVSTRGYLDQATWGYALAVFGSIRGEEKPAWTKHLRRDVRAVFSAGEKFLGRFGFGEKGLLE